MTTTEKLRRWKKLAQIRGRLLTEEKAKPRICVGEMVLLRFQIAQVKHAHAQATEKLASVEQRIAGLLAPHAPKKEP